MLWHHFAIRLGLALVLGAFIGAERQWRQRMAGLRINALVAAGAAMFVMLSALFPMYLNTFAGIRGVDSKLGELGHVLGLRRSEMIRHIVLPGALPAALTGLQLSVVFSMIALVVGEQINATSGLGFMITQAQQFLNNSVIMVALIVYAILALLANGAVRLLERKALAWRREFGQ